MSVTPSLPQFTTTPPPPSSSDPPRRRFGSFNSNTPSKGSILPSRNTRPSSSSSTNSFNSSTNPNTAAALVPPPLGPQRTRSGSSASSVASASTSTPTPIANGNGYNQNGIQGPGGVQGQGPAAFDIGLAADKAQQWLSTWAPRGEGRSREFLTNTLNGVASVASQVSSNLNRDGLSGVVGRSNSFASQTPSGQGSISNPGSTASPSTSPEERFGNGSSSNMSTSFSNSNSNSNSTPDVTTPPPTLGHTSSTPAMLGGQPLAGGGGRRIPQPANLARLGQSSSSATSTPTISNTNLNTNATSGISKSIKNNSSTTSLPTTVSRTSTSNSMTAPTLHGPSHLNPNAPHPPPGSGHRRNSSTTSNPSVHKRSSSFGILSKSPSISRSASLTTKSTTGQGIKSAGMPYKVGFQPQGVRNDRTEEFVESRKLKGEDREREEGRLGRRWAKLVDLHFNPTTPTPTPSIPTLTRSSSSTFSISSLTSGGGDRRRSLLSIDGALDAFKPKEVWKGFKNGPGPGGEEGKKRAAEQAIVKWEDDGEVKKCRICQSSFSLSNRKHHCRLCGRIMCSLPPTPSTLLAVQIQLFRPANPEAKSTDSQGGLPPGTRREKCSLLLVADWKTGRGEEVEEGFIGWMKMNDGNQSDPSQPIHHSPNQNQNQNQNGNPLGKDKRLRRSRMSTSSINSTTAPPTIQENMEKSNDNRDIPLPQQPKEVQVKGVRVCRQCWNVVSRKQKMQDRQRVTGFAKLYSALRTLQSDIEELMPEFEDQLAELTESDNPLNPSPAVLTTHKQLLALLTQYEHLSKRIGGLTCDEGSSQAVVQSAVARSSAGFLAKEMVKLQTLQKLQKKAANAKRKSMRIHELSLNDSMHGSLDGSGASTPTSEIDHEIEDTAMVLQPLLEQEAQLEIYISDANAQRKYEDSKALSEALRDIRIEIDRITQRA
ncbi:uncharacterized protein IL334_001522 [Kwoniella shivajii]|uniref:FYVE-type domain-containing protein n=1 Tax=Kwoniella shivajii TaxID=564305 RepID=A0ABZ1CSI5_9TREE|nr:hypothetical protein IL334_001522 [Kwoniella shivajii]